MNTVQNKRKLLEGLFTIKREEKALLIKKILNCERKLFTKEKEN
jgi:hypothetical protein